jgi:hypothetical protein
MTLTRHDTTCDLFFRALKIMLWRMGEPRDVKVADAILGPNGPLGGH